MMIKIVNKGFSFTTTELLVLLALKKAKGIYGLFDDNAELSQKDINEIVFHLFKNGILDRNGDEFIISDEVSDILDDIIGAKRLIVFSASDESMYEQCAYVGKRSVYLRFDGSDSKRVHIYPADLNELAESVVDSGWGIESILPSTDSVIADDMDSITEDLDIQTLSKQEILSKASVHSLIEVVELKNNTVTSKVIVFCKGVDDYIICNNGNESKVYRYTEELIRKIIISEAEGKEYDFC